MTVKSFFLSIALFWFTSGLFAQQEALVKQQTSYQWNPESEEFEFRFEGSFTYDAKGRRTNVMMWNWVDETVDEWAVNPFKGWRYISQQNAWYDNDSLKFKKTRMYHAASFKHSPETWEDMTASHLYFRMDGQALTDTAFNKGEAIAAIYREYDEKGNLLTTLSFRKDSAKGWIEMNREIRKYDERGCLAEISKRNTSGIYEQTLYQNHENCNPILEEKYDISTGCLKISQRISYEYAEDGSWEIVSGSYPNSNRFANKVLRELDSTGKVIRLVNFGADSSSTEYIYRYDGTGTKIYTYSSLTRVPGADPYPMSEFELFIDQKQPAYTNRKKWDSNLQLWTDILDVTNETDPKGRITKRESTFRQYKAPSEGNGFKTWHLVGKYEYEDNCNGLTYSVLQDEREWNLDRGMTKTYYTYYNQPPCLDKPNLFSLNISPNPSSLDITLEKHELMTKGSVIRLLNLQGQELKSISIRRPDRVRIDLSDLPEGVYLLSLVGKDGVASELIRKE